LSWGRCGGKTAEVMATQPRGLKPRPRANTKKGRGISAENKKKMVEGPFCGTDLPERARGERNRFVK